MYIRVGQLTFFILAIPLPFTSPPPLFRVPLLLAIALNLHGRKTKKSQIIIPNNVQHVTMHEPLHHEKCSIAKTLAPTSQQAPCAHKITIPISTKTYHMTPTDNKNTALKTQQKSLGYGPHHSKDFTNKHLSPLLR